VEYVRNSHIILVGKPEGKDSFGDIGIDGRVILRQL
jgi:hypothetical protein